MGTMPTGVSTPGKAHRYAVYPPITASLNGQKASIALPGSVSDRTAFGNHKKDNNPASEGCSNTKAVAIIGVLATGATAVACYFKGKKGNNHQTDEAILRSIHPDLPELMASLPPEHKQLFVESYKAASPEEKALIKEQAAALPNLSEATTGNSNKIGSSLKTTTQKELDDFSMSDMLRGGIKMIGGGMILSWITDRCKGFLEKQGFEKVHQHLIMSALFPESTLSDLVTDNAGKFLKEKLNCPSWLYKIPLFFTASTIASPVVSEIKVLQRAMFAILPKMIKNPIKGTHTLINNSIEHALRCLI